MSRVGPADLLRPTDFVLIIPRLTAVATPFLPTFAVREVSSLDLKHVRRMIERHRVGILEIKVRGVDVAPESLRARLKPRGEESATLLIVGGPGPARAVLARRAPILGA